MHGPDALKTCASRRLRASALLLAMIVMLSACATAPRDPFEPYDPFEGFNRSAFALNDTLDRALIEPAARGYRAVTPDFFRVAVQNFLRNLNSPLIFANQVLQGDIGGAGEALIRFVLNTTIGIGGLIDVGAQVGMAYEAEDFGQTLAVWGIEDSPYLVIPFLGPSTLRDGIGFGVETFADPVTLYLTNNDLDGWRYARTGTGILVAREDTIEIIDDLRETSFDYYAAVRSSYLQRRRAAIRDGAPEVLDFPDFEDFEATRRQIERLSQVNTEVGP